jgi:hypothetical protein
MNKSSNKSKRLVESFEEYTAREDDGFTGIRPSNEQPSIIDGGVGVAEPVIFKNLNELKEVLASGKIVRVDYSFNQKLTNFENSMNFTYYMQQKPESFKYGNIYLSIPSEREDYKNATYIKRSYSEMRPKEYIFNDSLKSIFQQTSKDVLSGMLGKESPSWLLPGGDHKAQYEFKTFIMN